MSQSLSSRSRSWFVGRSRDTAAAWGSSQRILGSRFVGLAGHWKRWAVVCGALLQLGHASVCGVIGGVYPLEVGDLLDGSPYHLQQLQQQQQLPRSSYKLPECLNSKSISSLFSRTLLNSHPSIYSPRAAPFTLITPIYYLRWKKFIIYKGEGGRDNANCWGEDRG